MPAFNQPLSLFADETRGLLLPGEILLGLESAQAAAGASRIERDPIPGIQIEKPDPNQQGPGGIERAATAAFDFVTIGPTIDDSHLVGGITATGSSSSIAASIDRLSVRLNVLAVTDKRVLFLQHDGAKNYALLVAVDRRAVASARSHPTFGQRGRIELVFTDGSAISLMAGMLSRRAALRLLAAPA